jgi:hypothetical protein
MTTTMGHLRYGSPAQTFDIDDRTLAHVEIVTLAKLRRGEPFALTVPSPTGGRSTLWVNAASMLVFELDADAGPIDRAWLETLIEAANTAVGLRLPSA